MYFVLYVCGAAMILFSMLNDEILGTLNVTPPDEGLLVMLDIMLFCGGIALWCVSEFKINKNLNNQYKLQWIRPIFAKNWNLLVYEANPDLLKMAMKFALCSDAFLQRVISLELNDYAIGLYGGFKCYFMDVQSVKKDSSHFKGQIFGIQMERKKFDRRITLRPSSIHKAHTFDSLPIMQNANFSSRFSFFTPMSGSDLGPSRKQASTIERHALVSEVPGWTKIQLMDKEEISSASFFTPDVANFLLNSSYGYTGISLYKDMIFLFFSETAANSDDVFEFHKFDVFRSENVIVERIQKEFGGCMNMLKEFINVLHIDRIPRSIEANIEHPKASSDAV